MKSHRNKLIFEYNCNIMKPIKNEVGNDMGNFFNPDGSIMKALGRIADLAILNLLWLICSLPVVTMGAATTALLSVTLKMVKNEESYIFRGYIKALKRNFKQSTIIWLVLLAVMIVLGTDYYIISHWDSQLKYLLLTVVILAGLILLFVELYIFPLIAKFENTVGEYFKNAVLMSIRHLPYTLILAVIFGMQVYACFYMLVNYQFLPILILFGESAFVYVMSYLYAKIFRGYEAVPEDEGTI